MGHLAGGADPPGGWRAAAGAGRQLLGAGRTRWSVTAPVAPRVLGPVSTAGGFLRKLVRRSRDALVGSRPSASLAAAPSARQPRRSGLDGRPSDPML